VRIDAKKLRYLAEFVARLYARRDTRRYLRRLAAVQTALGGLNDLTGIKRWVETAAATLPTRERRLVARICRDYAVECTPVLARQMTDAWRKLGRTRPFWA
jgi:CHAD domain-containing protein